MARWNVLAAVALLATGALAAPLPAGASSEDEHAPTDWSLGWDGLKYRAAGDAGQGTGGQANRAVAGAPPRDGLVSGAAASQSGSSGAPVGQIKQARLDSATVEAQVLYVISGRGLIKYADESRTLAAGDLLEIPKGLRHSFEQLGDTPLVVLMNATPGRGGPSGAAAR
jgi:hypothetical protein